MYFINNKLHIVFFSPKNKLFRCEKDLISRLNKAVVKYAEDTELVRAFFAAMDFVFIIDWDLTTSECKAVRKVLKQTQTYSGFPVHPSPRGQTSLQTYNTPTETVVCVINLSLHFHTSLCGFIRL